jgi:putative membrane protein
VEIDRASGRHVRRDNTFRSAFLSRKEHAKPPGAVSSRVGGAAHELPGVCTVAADRVDQPIPETPSRGTTMKCVTKGLALALTLALVLPLAARADSKKIVEKRDPNAGPQTDQEFVAWAIASDLAEIKFGEYAAKHAENQAVRKFAQAMVDAHTKHRDKLLKLAKTWKLAVVEGVGKGHRDEMVRLMKLKGGEFDREFMSHLVAAHEKAVKRYEAWTTKAKDSELREIATKTVAVVKEHLRLAREVQGKLKA